MDKKIEWIHPNLTLMPLKTKVSATMKIPWPSLLGLMFVTVFYDVNSCESILDSL